MKRNEDMSIVLFIVLWITMGLLGVGMIRTAYGDLMPIWLIVSLGALGGWSFIVGGLWLGAIKLWSLISWFAVHWNDKV